MKDLKGRIRTWWKPASGVCRFGRTYGSCKRGLINMMEDMNEIPIEDVNA